jgi:hypothetical protein
MKNVIYVFVLIFVLASCKVNQHIEKSEDLRPGMTMEEVEEEMYNDPIKTDFYKNIVECHYCNTSKRASEYVVLYFLDGKLYEKRNYSVLSNEIKGNRGSCEKFVKMGNFKEPNTITEIRLKN